MKLIVRKDYFDDDILQFYEKTNLKFLGKEQEYYMFSCHIDHFSDEELARHMATNKKAEVEVKFEIC